MAYIMHVLSVGIFLLFGGRRGQRPIAHTKGNHPLPSPLCSALISTKYVYLQPVLVLVVIGLDTNNPTTMNSREGCMGVFLDLRMKDGETQ